MVDYVEERRGKQKAFLLARAAGTLLLLAGHRPSRSLVVATNTLKKCQGYPFCMSPG